MKLLVAEDEPKTGSYLQQGLTEAGFTVDRVTTGTDALQYALSEVYDLLILDVMMPGLDGWEVLRMVRSAGHEIPVLLKRRAVRAGKRIDLTAKEFSLLELLMRRRGEVLPKSLIASQVWDMNFDSDTNVIEVAVRRLRAKVDDDFEHKLIHTVRGMGYMMDAPE